MARYPRNDQSYWQIRSPMQYSTSPGHYKNPSYSTYSREQFLVHPRYRDNNEQAQTQIDIVASDEIDEIQKKQIETETYLKAELVKLQLDDFPVQQCFSRIHDCIGLLQSSLDTEYDTNALYNLFLVRVIFRYLKKVIEHHQKFCSGLNGSHDIICNKDKGIQTSRKLKEKSSQTQLPTSDNNNLQIKVQQLSEEIQVKDQKIINLMTTVEKHSINLQQLKTKNQHFSEAQQHHKDQLQEKQMLLIDKTHDIEKLNTQLAVLNDQIGQLKLQINQNLQQIQQQEELKLQLLARIEQQSSQYTEQDQQIQNLNNQLQNKQSYIEQQEQMINELHNIKAQTNSYGFQAPHNISTADKMTQTTKFIVQQSCQQEEPHNIQHTKQLSNSTELPIKINKLHKIIILAVPASISKDILHAHLKQIDPTLQEVMDIKLQQRPHQENKTIDWICSLPRKSALLLVQQRNIVVNMGSYKVRPFTSVIKCYNCQQFYHVSKQCPHSKCCKNCSQPNTPDHQFQHCSNSPFCINCHNFNNQHNTYYSVYHPSNSPSCSSFQIYYRLERIKVDKKFLYSGYDMPDSDLSLPHYMIANDVNLPYYMPQWTPHHQQLTSSAMNHQLITSTPIDYRSFIQPYSS